MNRLMNEHPRVVPSTEGDLESQFPGVSNSWQTQFAAQLVNAALWDSQSAALREVCDSRNAAYCLPVGLELEACNTGTI